MIQFWSMFSEITCLLVWLGIPAYLFYRCPKTGEKNLGPRFMLGTIGSWAGLVLHRELIGLPVAIARAEAEGDLLYDGVGGNAALLFGGWILGIISSAVALVAYLALNYIRRHKDQFTSPGSSK